MRLFIVMLVALAASACGQRQQRADAAGCQRSATHQVVWSEPDAPDTIAVRADGPTCAQAVVTLTVRNSSGDPLWAFASTYFDMQFGGRPPEGASAVTEAEMDQFLAGWANVTEMRSSELPQWREDAATLTESAQTFAYETPFDREIYQTLWERNLPMLCYAAGAEAVQCLIVDPASQSAAMLAAYGP